MQEASAATNSICRVPSEPSDFVGLIRGVEAGNSASTTALWSQVAPRLTWLCRFYFRRQARRVIDEEDLVLDTFFSIQRRIEAHAYAAVATESEFWRIIRISARRRFISHLRHVYSAKRVVREEKIGECARHLAREDVATSVDYQDLCNWLLRFLDGDKQLKSIAEYWLDGTSTHQISERLHMARREVSRKIDVIRKRWRIRLTPLINADGCARCGDPPSNNRVLAEGVRC
jgi:DNA-directed RNA polymerase specialized sigma24 family protein